MQRQAARDYKVNKKVQSEAKARLAATDSLPSPLGAPEEMGVSQGLGRSRGKGWNFVGFARKAEEA